MAGLYGPGLDLSSSFGSLSMNPGAFAGSSASGSTAGMGYGSLMMSFGSAISGALATRSQSKVLKYSFLSQQVVADANAYVAELSAQSALLRGNAEIARLTLGAGQVRSSQRARLAASGIDLDVGNAREIQASTEMLKNADVGTLKANAIKSAFGYKAQGLNYQSEALMKGLSASTVNSNTAMTGSLLSGASQVASSWYAMNKAGVFASSGSGASLWG